MIYAVNTEQDKKICFPKSKWTEVNPPWTNEILTNDIYNCTMIDVPYEDNVNIEDFDTIDNKIAFNDSKRNERINIKHIQQLRYIRNNDLIAFDKYKTNVLLGLEGEDKTIPKDIMDWYKAILDLQEKEINNPPIKIKYYL